MKKKIIISLLAISVLSCSSDESDTTHDNFAGFYKVTSINSETPIDLNNDGIVSTDILMELLSPHVTMDGVFSGFYNLEDPQNMAEAKIGADLNSRLMSFNFPEQNISYLNFDATLNIPVLLDYSTSMNTYGYSMESNGQITFTDFNATFNSQFGEIIGIVRETENNFSLSLKKRMFNFYTKQWVLLDLTATYHKV